MLLLRSTIEYYGVENCILSGDVWLRNRRGIPPLNFRCRLLYFSVSFVSRTYHNLVTSPDMNYCPINVKGTLLHGAGARKICATKWRRVDSPEPRAEDREGERREGEGGGAILSEVKDDPGPTIVDHGDRLRLRSSAFSIPPRGSSDAGAGFIRAERSSCRICNDIPSPRRANIRFVAAYWYRKIMHICDDKHRATASRSRAENAPRS